MSLSRRKSLVLGLITISLGVGLSFALGEAAVRLMGGRDVHGTFRFRGYRIQPHRYTGEVFRADIDRFLTGEAPGVAYDPILGWVDVVKHDGPELAPVLRSIHRDTTEYTLAPVDGLLRIVLVGDSYTRSAEVGYEDSWGLALQERLKALGIRAEVLNLGVGSYGMDQAYLRWTGQGRALRPDILLFGFQPENLKRNMNLFRPFYTGGVGFFLSKPRFVLDGDSLTLHNVPALEPQDIPAFVDEFWDNPLSEYEAFRRREYEFVPFWMHSRLVASTVAIWRRRVLLRNDFPESTFFDVDSEGGRLGLKLIAQMEEEAQADSTPFVVLHLPRARWEVIRSLRGNDIIYPALLDTIKSRHDVIDAFDALADAAREAEDPSAIHMPHGHYSALANRVVGELAADTLASWIRSGRLELNRLR